MKATRESDPGLRKSAGQRKPVWPALLPALFALVFGGISPAAQESAASATVPPNIVFIIADDLSWAHLGAYGSDEVRTPNLDRLAREGVVFENAFVSTPSCTPSRASILTGRNGFELEEGATLWGYLPARFATWTELLAQHGYRVGATGKGWAPGFLIDREVNPAGRPWNGIRNRPYGDRFEELQMSDIDYAANFEAFLDAADETQPFSFWMGTFEPHRGYTEGVAAALGIDSVAVTVPPFMPDADEVRDDIAEYYAEIEYIDAQAGRVMEALERRGLQDNTIVVFTSDNGMPFPRAKATLYDYGTRMPLLFWWGDNIAGGRRIENLVSLTDIAPTLLEFAGLEFAGLEFAGVEAQSVMSGQSLAPLLIPGRPGLPAREAVYMYRERHGFYPDSGGMSYPSRAIRTHDHLLIWNARPDAIPLDVDGGPARTFMEENAEEYPSLHALSFGPRSEYELYDVRADAWQMRNLAEDGAYAELLESLGDRLFGYLESRQDPRMLGRAEEFLYAPYFGVVFGDGLLRWTPEQQGQEMSFDERRELLRRAFTMIGEEAFFRRMISEQDGRL